MFRYQFEICLSLESLWQNKNNDNSHNLKKTTQYYSRRFEMNLTCKSAVHSPTLHLHYNIAMQYTNWNPSFQLICQSFMKNTI